MNDTSPAADARYHELLQQMTPAQRFAAVGRLSMAVRRLAIAGIRLRHPLADDDEVRARLATRLYGRACAERLFGPLPQDAA